MYHTIDQIIQQLMIDLGLVTDPVAASAWPCYYSHIPDTPDNAVCVYHTTGRIQGRTHFDGVSQEFYGIALSLRSVNQITGYQKIIALVEAFDQDVNRDTVVIDTYAYLVHAITRTSGPIPLGRETPASQRRMFSANFLASISETTVPGSGSAGSASGS